MTGWMRIRRRGWKRCWGYNRRELTVIVKWFMIFLIMERRLLGASEER